MLVLEGRRRIARRPEELRQLVAPEASAGGNAVLYLVVCALARGVAEEPQVEREGAVFLETNDLLHLLDIGRLAIGREAHDLVLVAIMREADELRHRLVEDAQRMWEINAAVD